MPRRAPSFIDELDDGDPARESFRQVRAGILRVTTRPCVLTVTRDPALPSVLPTALDLGLSLSDAGHKVVVVDASLEPEMPEGGPHSAGAGLSDHLEGAPKSGRGNQLWTEQWRGLRVMSAGEGLSAMRDRMDGARMAAVVERLERGADYVLLAAPEATTAEAVALGALAEATILAVADGATRHGRVREITAHHAEYGSDLAGAIVVPRQRRRDRRRERRRQREAMREARREEAPQEGVGDDG